QGLTKDRYTITMRNGNQVYPYSWLVKVDFEKKKEWFWKYPIHELVMPKPGWIPIVGNITGGYIDSGRFGARSKDPMKSLSDFLISAKYLQTVDANDTRMLYYAYQNARDAGQLEIAMKYAKLRVARAAGIDQEAYLCYLYL